jgi:hypothetical protein
MRTPWGAGCATAAAAARTTNAKETRQKRMKFLLQKQVRQVVGDTD